MELQELNNVVDIPNPLNITTVPILIVQLLGGEDIVPLTKCQSALSHANGHSVTKTAHMAMIVIIPVIANIFWPVIVPQIKVLAAHLPQMLAEQQVQELIIAPEPVPQVLLQPPILLGHRALLPQMLADKQTQEPLRINVPEPVPQVLLQRLILLVLIAVRL